MRQEGIRGRSGFTLAELLLAAAMLVFVLSGLLLLFTNCILLNEANRNLAIASSHAQYVMEEIKNADFSTVKASINSGNWNWNRQTILSKCLTTSNGECVALDSEALYVTPPAGTDPLEVEITVTWQDRGGKPRNLLLKTLLTQI
jgi:Tfp pilus assembly protein PilW